MITLQVVPKDIVDMLNAEGIPLSIFADIQQMRDNLSVHDMADIHSAVQGFPFTFDPELGIVVEASPLARMALDDNSTDNMRYRVEDRIASQALKRHNDVAVPLEYTLNPVGENLWVVVQQRLHTASNDPDHQLLSSHQTFYECLIAQVLHALPFEKVCKTNLFINYLESLPPHAA